MLICKSRIVVLERICYYTNCVTYRKLDSSGLYFTAQIANRIGGFGQIGLSAGVVYISSQKVKIVVLERILL